MALPQQLKSARMTNATLASSIDDEVGNLEKALSDILGIPINTDITAALFSVTPGGVVTILQDGLVLSRLGSHILFAADNTYDIGSAGALRPRDLYLARNAAIAGNLSINAAATIIGQTVIGRSASAAPDRLAVYTSTVGLAKALRLWNGHEVPGDAVMLAFSIEADQSAFGKGAIIFERTGSFGVGKLHLATRNIADTSDVSLADARLTIDKDGLVGIGVTSPTKRLTVTGGGLQLLGGAHSGIYESSSCIADFDATTSTTRVWSVGTATSRGRFEFRVRDTAATPSEQSGLVIDASGNVGIGGVTSPTAALDIGSGGIRVPDMAADPTLAGLVQRNGTKLKFYDGTQVWTLNQGAQAAYAVRGLVGQNDPTTPNTRYQLAADLVQLRNPADGSIVVRVSSGALTNDIGVAGPAANGRDQSAAFPASVWIHFYFIWDGTTLSTISSLTAPPTGPTLPPGYTHWAYAGTVLYDTTPALARTRMRGATVWYDAHRPVLVNGGATTETVVGLGGFVPPNALTVTVFGRARVNTNSGGGDISAAWLRVVSGTTYAELEVLAQFGNDSSMNSSEVTLPQIGQSVIYLWGSDSSPANVALRALSLWVKGYTVPNGDA